MAVLGVTNTFSSGTAIVASQMNTNFDDIEAFVNTTPGLLQLDGGTITGAIQLNNTLTLGSSGAGHDVKLWGDTSGDYFEWDADTNKLTIEGANGTTALDVSDGNVVIGDGTLTVGSDGYGEDVTFYSDTAGDSFVWDSSAEKLTITGTATNTALDIADGNVTIADDLDVDGTTNLDAVDIDGAVQIDGTVTVGVNDTGHDVKFFGATDTAYMLWDEDVDELIVDGAGTAGSSGGLTVQTTVAGGAAHVQIINDAQAWKWLVNGSIQDSMVLRDQTGGVNRFAFTTAGRFGIGTTSPAHELHVQGDTPTYQITSTNAMDTGGGTETLADIDFEGQKNSLYRTTARIRARQDGTWSSGTADDANTALEFWTNADAGIAKQMTLSGTGVLILHNGTDMTPDSGANGQLRIDSNGYSGYVALDGTSMYIGHNSGGRHLEFQVDEATRMTIEDGAGRVGIGPDYDATYTLDVKNATQEELCLRLFMTSDDTSNHYLARFTRNTGLLTNGIYCDTTTAYFGTPSDERLKRDIETIDSGNSLAAVTALRPVNFRYIADPDDRDIRQGLVAQEAELHVPASVHAVIEQEQQFTTESQQQFDTEVDEDGNETQVPRIDADGNTVWFDKQIPILDDDGNNVMAVVSDYKMVEWAAVTTNLVGAVQELTARLEALEAA